MKSLTAITLGLSVVALSACGSFYDREPAYESSPRVERAPAPASTGSYERRSASDQMVHDKVHAALQRAPSLRGTDIAITVNNGRVDLRGTVSSKQQQQAAHDVVHSVDGVRSVGTEDLRVR